MPQTPSSTPARAASGSAAPRRSPATPAPPDGTRFALPPLAAARRDVSGRLHDLYDAWGYEPVEVPALERYDPQHPRAEQSFKLSDRDSGVLALRSDFTPALAGVVRAYAPEAAAGARPLRLRYEGTVWHAIHPDMARVREFRQIGIELIGVSNARADAELIHLARESVRAVGLDPRVEVGAPGFVRALFDLADVPDARQGALADALDRKDAATLGALLTELAPPPELRRALERVPDLYGGTEALAEARRAAPWPETRAVLDRLEAVLSEFEDDSDLLLDLGMARRLSYYTGITFRAYTFDFGQPLLGGGRYDGALLPHAAGFSIGLERLMGALPGAPLAEPPAALALDDAAARRLRAAGWRVARALSLDPAEARAEARAAGAPFLVGEGRLEPVAPQDGEGGAAAYAGGPDALAALGEALAADLRGGGGPDAPAAPPAPEGAR